MAHKKIILGLSLAVTFLVGCLVGQVVIPPVRAGTNPQRWEYMCAPNSEANKAGAQGWELVQIEKGTSFSNNWCFKRTLP